jgi:hypothetical protein
MLSYRDFLGYAESFSLEAGREIRSGEYAERQDLVTASLLFSWIAIESFINNMMLDFVRLPEGELLIHERAFLAERAIEFVESGRQAGEFRISNRVDYIPLEHKILFLIAKFGRGTRLNKGDRLWQRFQMVKQKRDQITHPRKSDETPVTLEDAADALEVAKAIINTVSERIWGESVTF